MLTTLRIKNLALVADMTVELRPGYNVITGETGAGKSILIGALSLVLGERADRTLIRSGAETCSVEAAFDVSRVHGPLTSFLEKNGLEQCEDNQLLLKRVFTSAGSNRQFINGTATTLATLANVGEWLVDIHGPHEHQSLLHPGRQLAILDAFGQLDPYREAFAELLRRRNELEKEKASLIVDERTYAQQLDLLRFQVGELAAAQVQSGEDVQVEEDYQRVSNAAKLLQIGQSALNALGEDESSVFSTAGIVGRSLQELQRLDPTASTLVAQQELATAALRELQDALSRYLDRIEVDPARQRELEERLNLVQSLKRKYGPTLTDVIAFGEQAKQKLQSLEQRDTELARLNEAIAKADGDLWRAGRSLSAKRRKLIPQLREAAEKQLAELGFKTSRFDVEINTREQGPGQNGAGLLNPAGLDAIDFQFAPNPGEPPRPLRAIASSGELARVMLALKTVLAEQDQVPVLVFDEVDANVGGETAHAVGAKMRQIARHRQVLCITHLAQVAATAGAHFVAAKQVKAGRTISEIALLDDSERVTELARMLGGQTEASRRHAEELLK